MAKKFSTEFKNIAVQAIKEAEYRRINTDVYKKDMVQYSQFPWWITPNSSFFQKLIGVFFNWLGLLIPIFGIYFFNNLFNLLFRSVKINTIRKSRVETITRPDRRYKTGKRVVGRRTVVYYMKDITKPYVPLSEKEVIHNRIWAIVLLALLGVSIYQSIGNLLLIDVIGYVIVDAFLGLIWSVIKSYFLNKKKYSAQT